jgi:hypothetical protein
MTTVLCILGTTILVVVVSLPLLAMAIILGEL